MTAAAIDDVRDRPLPWFTGRLHEVLDDLGAPPTWPMSDAQLALTARELKRAIARLEGHLLAVVAEADRNDTAAKAGATGTAGWVRGATGVSGPASARLVRDARKVAAHEPVQEALLAGALLLDQAQAISTAGRRGPGRAPRRRGGASAGMRGRA